MFSSVARAFSTYAVKPALQPRLFSGVMTARPMSSAGAGGPDTSVVDTCLKKIQTALGSDNVQVTGTSTSDVTSRRILSSKVDLAVEPADDDQ
jgi:hypothetical protein